MGGVYWNSLASMHVAIGMGAKLYTKWRQCLYIPGVYKCGLAKPMHQPIVELSKEVEEKRLVNCVIQDDDNGVRPLLLGGRMLMRMTL